MRASNARFLILNQFLMVRSPGFEPGSSAPQADALSLVLRARDTTVPENWLHSHPPGLEPGSLVPETGALSLVLWVHA